MEEGKTLFAVIKYRTGGEIDYVPVTDIEDFNPLNINDFDRNKLDYVIKTNKNVKDHRTSSWYIRIGKLGGRFHSIN